MATPRFAYSYTHATASIGFSFYVYGVRSLVRRRRLGHCLANLVRWSRNWHMREAPPDLFHTIFWCVRLIGLGVFPYSGAGTARSFLLTASLPPDRFHALAFSLAAGASSRMAEVAGDAFAVIAGPPYSVCLGLLWSTRHALSALLVRITVLRLTPVLALFWFVGIYGVLPFSLAVINGASGAERDLVH